MKQNECLYFFLFFLKVNPFEGFEIKTALVKNSCKLPSKVIQNFQSRLQFSETLINRNLWTRCEANLLIVILKKDFLRVENLEFWVIFSLHNFYLCILKIMLYFI